MSIQANILDLKQTLNEIIGSIGIVFNPNPFTYDFYKPYTEHGTTLVWTVVTRII